MKRSLLIAFLLISTITFSQPVVEGTYLPVRNTSVLQVWDTTSNNNLIAPTTGANQVWDYSTLFVSSADTFEVKALDVDDTPHGSYFPESNLATYWNVPFSLQDSLYNYFLMDTAGLHKLGGWSEKASIDTLFTSTPMETVMPFKVSYQMNPINQSYLNVGYGDVTYLNNDFKARYAENRSKTFTGVAYGTLTTPMGTFDDVVVLEEHVTGTDTIWIDLDNNPNTGYEGYEYKFSETPVNHKYFHFLRNNTFASTHLMLLKYQVVGSYVQYGWYTLPVDFGSIEGDVFDSTGAAVTDGEMYLYREHSNFTRNDILATAQLDGNGHYRFDSIPYGEYRIACRPNLTLYTGAITTYYGDTTDWVNCPTVITTDDTVGVDIHLKYTDDDTGNGEVSGNLNLDFNYGKNSWGNPNILGEPVSGINVSLEQIPGGIVNGEQTTTITNGTFTLPNVAPGVYEIWVDIPGMYMAGTYEVEITSNGEIIGNMDFIVGEDTIWPATWPSNIDEVASNDQSIIAYPNPFTDQVRFEISANESSSQMQLVAQDVLGNIVKQRLLIGTSRKTTNWDLGTFPSGIYFISLVQDGKTTSTIKLIKQ